jgi:hypothetical protein
MEKKRKRKRIITELKKESKIVDEQNRQKIVILRDTIFSVYYLISRYFLAGGCSMVRRGTSDRRPSL